MTERDTAAAAGTRTITITRVFDAPRELAFRAWIDPVHIVRWFYASEGWTTPFAETDPRAGGAFRIGFASPDGKGDFTFEGVYDEVVAPERLVFTIGDGRPVVVTLVEHGGKTKLDLVLALEDTYSEEQQREGWTAMLVHLGEYLSKV
jgi:uncharacterized protein YndB with AHSA1/START domain